MAVKRQDLLNPALTTWFVARLVAAVVALNVIVLSIAALSLARSKEAHEERAATASKNIALVLDRDVSATIDKVDLVVLAIADEMTRRGTTGISDDSELEAFIERQASRVPELQGLRTTDSMGNVNHGVGYLKGVRSNLADRDYFRALSTQPDLGLVISKPVISRVSGQWELVFARRIDAIDHSFGGVIYATIDLQYFASKFEALDVGVHGLVDLRDSDLGLIVRFPPLKSVADDLGKSGVSQRLHKAVVTGQSSGTTTGASGSDGVVRTTSFRRLSKYPLFVAVGMGTQDYLAQWYREMVTAMALLVGFLLLTVILAILISRSLYRREANLQALRIEERKFRTLLESSPDALVIVNSEQVVCLMNRQAELMFEFRRDELVGQPFSSLLSERSKSLMLVELSDVAASKTDTGIQNTHWAVTKNGREFPIDLSVSPIETEEGSMIAAAIRDMTDRRLSEARIEFLAHHDSLTGLPNRLLAQSRFEQTLKQAGRSEHKVAVLYLDLDAFKSVNDSYGHAVGDELLKTVAARLTECVRDADTVSRQGGDEFLIVLASLPDLEAARAAVDRLVQRFRQPCIIDEKVLSLSMSLGIALFPDDGHDCEALLKKADLAMYEAKAAGRNTHRYFDETMNKEATETLSAHNDLRRAIDHNEFVLHYQPQFELSSGRLVGAEALIRWDRPGLGLVPPGSFIPIAEANGLIVPIGEWVLGEACRQAVAWQRAGLKDLTMAVNISAVQFGRGDVDVVVRRALEQTGLNPGLLELELTESILIRDFDSVLRTITSLKSIGVKLSIDDFGTGYSSLSYLKKFAFDKLKIDRTFITDIESDHENGAIVRAIIQMAQGLHLKTIAEGVESAAAANCLLTLGCDEAQGYLFSRPVSAEDFEAHVAAGSDAATRLTRSYKPEVDRLRPARAERIY
jgi:diguanylate cyclase (GGDEF)-like protein/PAS domain S-box-containing protein